MDLSRIVHGFEPRKHFKSHQGASITSGLRKRSNQDSLRDVHLSLTQQTKLNRPKARNIPEKIEFSSRSASEQLVRLSESIPEDKTVVRPVRVTKPPVGMHWANGPRLQDRNEYSKLGSVERRAMYEALLNSRIAKGNLYCCEVCLRRFRRKNDLSRHLCIHFNIRSHVCNICSKTFVQKGSLNTHLRRHEKVTVSR